MKGKSGREGGGEKGEEKVEKKVGKEVEGGGTLGPLGGGVEAPGGARGS